MFKSLLRFVSILALSTVSTLSVAESSRDLGDYVIHYNAFRSDTLTPEVAKAYDLQRRNNRAIINIAVLKKVMNTTGTPTAAKVTGSASNLTGQLKNLSFREIREGNAIYYIADTQFADGEFLKFKLKVHIDGEDHAARVAFEKRFYTD